MKKIFLLLVFVFFPLQFSFSQVIVLQAAVDAAFGEGKIAQAIYWIQEALKWEKDIESFAKQLEATGKQIDMQMQNLASLKDVNNLDGFKDWYNRQLYYERMTEQTVKGMNVSIGKKNYSLWDIQGIADGLDDTYVQYWNKEFTEEQRREMWLSLGLTPANYAYVMPYRAKVREISKELFALSSVQNRKNEQYSDAMDEIADEMKADAKKNPENQMGTKQVMQRLLQMMFIQSEMLMDLNSNITKDLELKAAKEALDVPLKNDPELSSFPDNAWGLGK